MSQAIPHAVRLKPHADIQSRLKPTGDVILSPLEQAYRTSMRFQPHASGWWYDP